MIPKIIHYCWFGRNPLPPLALKCIASWKKYLPDYEIKEWNEDNFDVNIIPYTAEAYKQKKYAFVSDYARLWVMYHYGGLYFDTDVEVIKHIDDITSPTALTNEEGAHHGFMGFEVNPDGDNTPGKYAPRYCFAVNPGVGFGMTKGHTFMKQIMDNYQKLHFSGVKHFTQFKTIVAYTTELLCENGLRNIQGIQEIDGITIYPREYFAPINVITGRLKITENTRTIHRYAGSWDDRKKQSWKGRIQHMIPEWCLILVNRVKRRKYKL